MNGTSPFLIKKTHTNLVVNNKNPQQNSAYKTKNQNDINKSIEAEIIKTIAQRAPAIIKKFQDYFRNKTVNSIDISSTVENNEIKVPQPVVSIVESFQKFLNKTVKTVESVDNSTVVDELKVPIPVVLEASTEGPSLHQN